MRPACEAPGGRSQHGNQNRRHRLPRHRPHRLGPSRRRDVPRRRPDGRSRRARPARRVPHRHRRRARHERRPPGPARARTAPSPRAGGGALEAGGAGARDPRAPRRRLRTARRAGAGRPAPSRHRLVRRRHRRHVRARRRHGPPRPHRRLTVGRPRARTWHHPTSPSAPHRRDRGAPDRVRRRRREARPVPSRPAPDRAAEDLAVDLVLDASLLARKLAALRAHESQTSVVFDLLGPQRMAEWVRSETFVDARAWKRPSTRDVRRPHSPSSAHSGAWQTASTLLPSGSRRNAP